jgi:hypothetical protein
MGRRRPPVWVLSVLREVARSRARELDAIVAECDWELARRAAEPPRAPLARGPGGRWLPRGKE